MKNRFGPKYCVHCSSEFMGQRESSKFCSLACYWEHAKPKSKIDDLVNANQWFWNKVALAGANECWPWNGAKSKPQLYGRCSRFYSDGGWEYAHRVAFLLQNGKLPTVARHTCDNRLCCNPAHIIDGTAIDNLRDAVARDRVAYGERSAASKLTNKAVIEIRNSTLGHSELARIYGVSDSTILRARRGDSWRRVNPATI